MTMDIEKEILLERLEGASDLLFLSIAEHYESGNIDDPRSNHLMMNLIACICEKKVQGRKDEEGLPRWSLTEEYLEQLEEELQVATSENVIKGPWKRT